MPQLDSGGGGAGAGDDLGAPDELLAFQDEGEEQDDKSRDSAAGPERDLAELKSSLVNESEGAAAGAGVPGPGVRVHGEAEGAPEVSPARSSPKGLVLGWDRADPPPPRARGPRGSHPRTPSCLLRPSRPLCFALQALGREHTSQRLFPDKLAESLEDGELCAAREGARTRGGGVGGGFPGRR